MTGSRLEVPMTTTRTRGMTESSMLGVAAW